MLFGTVGYLRGVEYEEEHLLLHRLLPPFPLNPHNGAGVALVLKIQRTANDAPKMPGLKTLNSSLCTSCRHTHTLAATVGLPKKMNSYFSAGKLPRGYLTEIIKQALIPCPITAESRW